jgi:hypothetical protein
MSPTELAVLETVSVGQLAERWRELYGEPTRTPNKDYLKKRRARRIQELAEHGVSQGALARIHQLDDQMPERWRQAHTATARTEGLQVVQATEPPIRACRLSATTTAASRARTSTAPRSSG